MVRAVTEDDTGLRVLHEPPAADGSANSKMDIVAVHGIGAHPDETWSKNVGTKEAPRWVNWLSDETMLPAVVPPARIMRYGYESAWFGREATKQSSSHVARRLLLALRRKRQNVPYRPLLFIAHCFGGLVVLKALLDAKEDEKEWPGTFTSTTGLIFFGTPFRGAEGLSQSEMLDAARREYEPDQIQGDVLKVLEPGNEFLQDVVDKFGRTQSQPNKSRVACFFELKASNVGAIVGKQERTRFVVSESSGCLDLSEGTQKFSLSRNHFNMNKFGRADEEDFETVREVVEQMVEAADELVVARTQNWEKYATRFSLEGVPIVHKFVDRPAEMDDIERALLSHDGVRRQKVHSSWSLK